MTTLETLIEPLKHSPRLPEVVNLLQLQMEKEKLRRRKFYQQMTPEQKIEFIDGEIILHSPARNQHLDVTKFILKLVDTHVSSQKLGTVKVEKCLCVFPRNDYEPDVVFFGIEKTAKLTADTMKFPVPDLVVEVLSSSTEERDRGVKFEDFAANGVGEYWIVNAEDSVIEQYILKNGNYQLKLKSSSGNLQSKVIKGFEVKVAALFNETENLAALKDLIN
ncbi:MAG: Uma2 family endonuclease [Verrucomicrobiales bacterium]|nr:Uma2 family endonuclease [Verrucomicrobiales bacterium]